MRRPQLTLLRHGKSVWNEENRFTGWVDAPLAEAGTAEAKTAGEICAAAGVSFDFACASYLRRAIRTLWIVLEEMDLMWLPQRADWRFNERHYGALQGLNKTETAARHGETQTRLWRRGYSAAPPPATSEKRPNDGRYDDVDIPASESLRDVAPRVWAAFDEIIAPQLRQGRRVLLVSHGNALRTLIKKLDDVSDEDIAAREIATGQPLLYEFDDSLAPLSRRWLTPATR